MQQSTQQNTEQYTFNCNLRFVLGNVYFSYFVDCIWIPDSIMIYLAFALPTVFAGLMSMCFLRVKIEALIAVHMLTLHFMVQEVCYITIKNLQ